MDKGTYGKDVDGLVSFLRRGGANVSCHPVGGRLAAAAAAMAVAAPLLFASPATASSDGMSQGVATVALGGADVYSEHYEAPGQKACRIQGMELAERNALLTLGPGAPFATLKIDCKGADGKTAATIYADAAGVRSVKAGGGTSQDSDLGALLAVGIAAAGAGLLFSSRSDRKDEKSAAKAGTERS